MSTLRPRVAAIAACLIFISALSAACTEPPVGRGAAASPSAKQAVPSHSDHRDR
jgi:hypothetical protein